MTDELEVLEKKFIVSEEATTANLVELITRLTKFCKITNNGEVIFLKADSKRITNIDKIMIVLIARHLANSLQIKQKKEVTIAEEINSKGISNMLREQSTIINARLKELKDSKKVISVSKGVYKVAPYAIEDFLESIEKK
jgi:hypothetical protein